ncbi:MAG TPA: nucleotidyltransferase domain-containing protein [Mucilaginibacter sp.]|jgi:predicted nucleotidyltransferase|nr:nucleotidyltransferase domain-containing protein [Mucilaginibacter sp.]
MTNRRQQIKQWLKVVIEDNLQSISYKAFIFGSQANKEELSRSDIDVGILADQAIPDMNFVRIANAIEDLPMLYKIDLVDFYNVEDKFKAVAMKNVEWL